MAITHTHVSAIADDPTKDVSSSEWNDAHAVADGSLVAAKLSASATDVVFGRSSGGAGNGQEIAVTAAGRAILDDADAAAQRTTLGLGTLATQSGTFSGTSSGTNTGDQTLPTRASLGLATSDTPQFAGIEVGAASDTTLARSGAGDLTVEGNAIYRAGGTDVAVADGGTGASTAAAAVTNLGLDPLLFGWVLPSGALAQSGARTQVGSNLSLLSSGRISIQAIYLPKGLTVTSISFMSGTTPLAVGTHQWFGLFNLTYGTLRLTGDDTSTAWAANTVKTLNLSSQFVTTYAGVHYLGVLVTASTVPTMTQINGTANLANLTPALCGNANTGLTDPASCPNPLTGFGSAGGSSVYCYVS